ncbi:MAG: hypothetical protein BWY68_00652 [bacterium ADurb.Bin400]|nr:MAG: hypothetical protein BWY68_00652 [bacterium ADurb.Bin400]
MSNTDQEKITKQQNELYADLDSERIKGSFCTLWMVLVVLVAILVLLVSLLFVYRAKISAVTAKYFSFNSSQHLLGQDLLNNPEVINKLKTISTEINHQTAGGEIAVDENGHTIIRVDDKELSRAAGLEDPVFPLKNAALHIYSQGITLTGKTKEGWLSMNVEAVLAPRLEPDRILFEIVEIKVAGVSAPKQVRQKLDPQLSILVGNMVEGENQLKLTNITLYDGYLELAGQIERK